MNTNNTKQEATKESATHQKRRVLSSISNKVRRIREAKLEAAQTENEAMYWAGLKVNDLLMIFLHDPKGEKEFKTFHQWKQEGKTIKKGSRASLIWGQPLKAKGKQETPQHSEPPKTDTTEDVYKLFPLCYLFSNDQVI